MTDSKRARALKEGLDDFSDELVGEYMAKGPVADPEYDEFLSDVVSKRRVAFHPDDDFSGYVDAETGERAFSDEEAAEYQRRLDALIGRLGGGIYDVDMGYYANKGLDESVAVPDDVWVVKVAGDRFGEGESFESEAEADEFVKQLAEVGLRGVKSRESRYVGEEDPERMSFGEAYETADGDDASSVEAYVTYDRWEANSDFYIRSVATDLDEVRKRYKQDLYDFIMEGHGDDCAHLVQVVELSKDECDMLAQKVGTSVPRVSSGAGKDAYDLMVRIYDEADEGGSDSVLVQTVGSGVEEELCDFYCKVKGLDPYDDWDRATAEDALHDIDVYKRMVKRYVSKEYSI